MKKIISKIRKVVNSNSQTLKNLEIKGNRFNTKQDLFNAELMPSGFFDTYQKILFRPRRTIEQMKNE
jgi:hypothetical protein